MYWLTAMQAIHASPCAHHACTDPFYRGKDHSLISEKNYLILIKFLTSLHNCSPLLCKAMETQNSNLCWLVPCCEMNSRSLGGQVLVRASVCSSHCPSPHLFQPQCIHLPTGWAGLQSQRIRPLLPSPFPKGWSVPLGC